MPRQAFAETLQEIFTLVFLSAGPALGAAITLAWIAGLVMGLVAVITR